MIFAYFFVKEPITGKKAGGVGIALAGVPVLVRWEIGYLIIFATFIAYYLSKPNGPVDGTLGAELAANPQKAQLRGLCVYWRQRFCADGQFPPPPIQEICILCVLCGFAAKLSKGPMDGTLGMENPGESGKSSPNVGTK